MSKVFHLRAFGRLKYSAPGNGNKISEPQIDCVERQQQQQQQMLALRCTVWPRLLASIASNNRTLHSDTACVLPGAQHRVSVGCEVAEEVASTPWDSLSIYDESDDVRLIRTGRELVMPTQI